MRYGTEKKKQRHSIVQPHKLKIVIIIIILLILNNDNFYHSPNNNHEQYRSESSEFSLNHHPPTHLQDQKSNTVNIKTQK